jgi:hypothetical protein
MLVNRRKPYSIVPKNDFQIDRFDRGAGSAPGMLFDSWIEGCISIKIGGPPQPFQVSSRVDPQNFFVRGKSRLHPGPIGMFLEEARLGQDQPGWSFGVIIRAKPGCRLVENYSRHSSCPDYFSIASGIRQTNLVHETEEFFASAIRY